MKEGKRTAQYWSFRLPKYDRASKLLSRRKMTEKDKADLAMKENVKPLTCLNGKPYAYELSEGVISRVKAQRNVINETV